MRWWPRRRAGRWRGFKPLPLEGKLLRLLLQRGDAAGAIEVGAVEPAGVDPGDDRLAAAMRGVEIEVEDAGGARILELAGRPLAYVAARAAELRLEVAGSAADYVFESDRIVAHRRPRREPHLRRLPRLGGGASGGE